MTLEGEVGEVDCVRLHDVPVEVVMDRDKADYEVRGSSETEKAGSAKVIFTRQTKWIWLARAATFVRFRSL